MYPIGGNNIVGTPRFEVAHGEHKGRVWINSTQYFDCVSEQTWRHRIGGYQVCEKWLKDRKGRILSKDDIGLYRKIIVALSETIHLMNEVDKVIEHHGGWPDALLAD